jgi:hypothetical protein
MSFEYHEFFGEFYRFDYPREWTEHKSGGMLFFLPPDVTTVADHSAQIREKDLGIFLSILDCRESRLKHLSSGQLPSALVGDIWRQNPPYPQFRILNHKTADVRNADAALRVDFEYGSIPFQSCSIIAEKGKMLVRFQVYGTRSRVATLGSAVNDIVSSFHF